MKRNFALFLSLLLLLGAVSANAHAEKPVVLTVANQIEVFDRRLLYLTEYADEYIPSVRVRYQEINIDPYSLLALTKAANIDLIYWGQPTLLAAAKAGLLLPLDGDVNLMSTYADAEWLPFEPLLSYDSRLYGIPVFYSADLLSYDQKLAEESRFSLPQWPYDWTDVESAWYEAGSQISGEACLLKENLALPGLLMQYMSEQYARSGTVDFHAPSFKRSMEAYATLVRKGAVVHYESPLAAILSRKRYSATPALHPQVGDEPCIVVDMYALSIPRGSKHIPQATAFLGQYVKSEIQSKIFCGEQSHMLLQNPDVYPFWEDAYPEFCHEGLRQYIAKHWVPRFSIGAFIRYLNVAQPLMEYYKESISTDELCTLLQQTFDAMADKAQ